MEAHGILMNNGGCFFNPKVGIYKRKQENKNSTKKAIKKTRKKELNQEKKKKLSFFLVFLLSYFLLYHLWWDKEFEVLFQFPFENFHPGSQELLIEKLRKAPNSLIAPIRRLFFQYSLLRM